MNKIGILMFLQIIVINLLGQNYCSTLDYLDENTFKNAKLLARTMEYNIELFPGQEFSGDWYYWGNGKGHFSILPEVEWLDVEPDSIAATSGIDVQHVIYNFKAPMEQGIYETYVSCSTWPTIHVILNVSNTPISTKVLNVAKLDDSLLYRSRQFYNRYDNIGTSGKYFTDSTNIYEWKGVPNLNDKSVLIYPNPVEIQIDSSKYINTLFNGNVNDERLIQKIAKWGSSPTYIRYKQKFVQPKECVVSFDQEANQYISTNYYPVEGPVTMMYWVKFNELFLDQACGNRDGNNHRLYLGLDKSNNIYAAIGNGYTQSFNSNINPNEWVHLALVGSGEDAFVYLNGELVDNFSYSFRGSSENDVWIGQRNDYDDYYFPVKGSIDEFQIWNKALSEEEILFYMNQSHEGDEEKLALYYPFREGEGNFTKDFSKSGYTGYIPSELEWLIDIPNGDPKSTGIFKVTPNTAFVKQDTVELRILGYKLDNHCKVEFIQDNGYSRAPFETMFIDSLHLSVKLDIKNINVGEYDLSIINQTDDTLKLENCFSLLDEETIPFGEWVPFKANYGNAYLSAVDIPPLEELFVFVKKSTRSGYASTWKGSLKLKQGSETIARQTDGDNYGGNIIGGSYTDYSIQLVNPPSGLHTFEVDNLKADIQGEGEILFTANPAYLELNKWSKGKILRPYGSDWKMIEIPQNTDTVFIKTEGFGKWSTVDIFYENINQLENYWHFNNHGERYSISGKIIKPKAGKYFIKYMDSAVLQKDDSGNLYNHLGDQTREYFIYVGITDSIPQSNQELKVTGLSVDTLYTGISSIQVFGTGFRISDEIHLKNESENFIAGIIYDSIQVNNYLNVGFHLSDAVEGEWYIAVVRDNELFEFKDVKVYIKDIFKIDIDFEIIARDIFRTGRFQPLIVRVKNNGGSDLNFFPVTLTIPNFCDVEVRELQRFEYDSIQDLINPNETSIESQNYLDKTLNDITLIIPYLPPNETSELVYWINPQEQRKIKYTVRVDSPIVYFDNIRNDSLKSISYDQDCIDCLQKINKKISDFIVDKLMKKINATYDEAQEFKGKYEKCIADLKEVNPFIDPLDLEEIIKEILEAMKKSLSDNLSNNLPLKNSLIPNLSAQVVYPFPVDIHLSYPQFDAKLYNEYQSRLRDCLSDEEKYENKMKEIADLYEQLSNYIKDAKEFYDCWKECKKVDVPEEQNGETKVTGSTTPEDKYGPIGASTAINDSDSHHYIDSSKVFEYRVDYWNKEDATAPAAIVYIRDTLDTNFNLQSFNFTEVGFLKWKVKLDGGQYFNVNVDCRPEMPYIVNIEGTVDPESREAFWVHTTLDPKTMDLPEDPMAGYLPPIDTTGYQLGWVNYTIESNDSLPDGTIFKNQAFVNFDGVGKWGPAPKEGPYTNIYDLTHPLSSMHPAPAIVETDSVLLSWEGEDTGAGIQDYTIYVSEADSFYVWQSNLVDTTAYFHGENGKTYKFFSIAADRVGNIEPMKEDYEAMVTFNIPVYSSATLNNNFIEIYPNPTAGVFTVRNNCSSKIHIEVYNSLGESIYAKQANGIDTQIDMQGKANGMYLVKAKCNELVCVKKLIVN
jgi:hypothetical protein